MCATLAKCCPQKQVFANWLNGNFSGHLNTTGSFNRLFSTHQSTMSLLRTLASQPRFAPVAGPAVFRVGVGSPQGKPLRTLPLPSSQRRPVPRRWQGTVAHAFAQNEREAAVATLNAAGWSPCTEKDAVKKASDARSQRYPWRQVLFCMGGSQCSLIKGRLGCPARFTTRFPAPAGVVFR